MGDNQIQKEIHNKNQLNELSNDETIFWGQLLSEAKDTLTKEQMYQMQTLTHGFLWSTAFRLQRVSSF